VFVQVYKRGRCDSKITGLCTRTVDLASDCMLRLNFHWDSLRFVVAVVCFIVSVFCVFVSPSRTRDKYCILLYVGQLLTASSTERKKNIKYYTKRYIRVYIHTCVRTSVTPVNNSTGSFIICSISFRTVNLSPDSVDFLFGLLFDPEDGDDIFLRNVGLFLNDTALQPRWPYTSSVMGIA
jgi:hypothetical protein